MRTFIVQVYNEGRVIPITIKAEDAAEASRRVEAGLASGKILSVIIPKEEGA